MLTPRHAIAAGIVLVAVAAVLATGGHGFWVLFGLFWVFGPRCGRHHGARRASIPRHEPAEPDPTRDRHEAFPGSR